MKTKPTDTPLWITLACAAFIAPGAWAQEKPFTQPPLITKPPAPPPATVATNLTEVFTKGKIGLNALLRYEYADQRGLKESYLGSISTRFGFTTATYEGFQAQLEGENITALTDEDKFNAAGSNGQPGRTVIADPETTEINQAWISYNKFDTTAKLGRQRIVLDNWRWVGDVVWRQNRQTYDAMLFQNKSIKNLELIYSYVWHVNRIFGDVTGLPIANQDLDSNSHLIHADYTGFKWAKLVGYAYLLDFNNDLPNAVARNLSSATYGGYAQGSQVWDKENNGKVNYRGEFAIQTDYGSSTLNYTA
ncbi:MAG: alginate export family protein, partial [Verrucomicrobiae bacterium]|nr:alginate export family protein [Verrucomicrobiae bacterium]